jgi:hypothetical protein
MPTKVGIYFGDRTVVFLLMTPEEQTVQKVKVRRGKLMIPLSDEMLAALGLRDGDALQVSCEAGRIVVTPMAEEALPGEMEALDQAEGEFARGETRHIDDILHGLGRKVK